MFFEFSCLVLILTILAIHNWSRTRLVEIKELVPNCLLTNHPLVFVSGRKSIFYFLAYWNSLPHWLASHGYEVFNLNLAWKNPFQRKLKLGEFLQKTSKDQRKLHLFIDSSTYLEFTEILNHSEIDCLASVTCVGGTPQESISQNSLRRFPIPIEEIEVSPSETPKPIFWKFHLIWTGQSLKTEILPLGWESKKSEQSLKNLPVAQKILDRARFLAERDLLQASSSPSLNA